MMLRLLLIGVAATSGAVSPAQAQSLLCDNGAEERIVEVIKPGNVGKACDLRILSDGGETISVPYNANNQESYCEARIPDVVKMLAASNFECAVTQTFADAQAQATSDSSNGEVSVADVAPAPTPDTDAVASAIMSASDPVEAQSFSDAAEESVYGEL